MKKSLVILIVIVAILAIIGIGIGMSYNEIVTLKENVSNEYSNINVQLERRADLIPNLVNTVKGYVEHEEKTIEMITSARENLLKANTVDEKAKANEDLDNALNALMVVVENYPDLKANENFINLQDELAGTENRISTVRRDYNEAVKSYNTKIQKFPTNIIAKIFNFEKEAYFEVEESKTENPTVDFS